jgi:hypothetical protein
LILRERVMSDYLLEKFGKKSIAGVRGPKWSDFYFFW